MYEGHPENKERFTISRYSLTIIQKLNIQVLAHTFVYYFTKSPLTLRHLSDLSTSLCKHSSYHVAPDSILRSSSFAKSLPARCSFTFGKRKKYDDARFTLYGGCSKMSRWKCSSSKAWVCRAVCGRALLCNRTISRESLPLRQ